MMLAIRTRSVDHRVSVLYETFGPELETDAEWEKQLLGNEGFVI
jgi:hypothetical protein